jgi:hypothetical protein
MKTSTDSVHRRLFFLAIPTTEGDLSILQLVDTPIAQRAVEDSTHRPYRRPAAIYGTIMPLMYPSRPSAMISNAVWISSSGKRWVMSGSMGKTPR